MGDFGLDEKKEQYTKWVNRICEDPTGLEVLGNRLGLVLKAKEELKGAPVVAVLVPSYAGMNPKMMDSCSRMVHYAQKFCTVFSEPVRGSSIIAWTRNDLQAGLHGKKYTHVLMIDDDMEVEEDFLVRMLAHDVDIVGCLYTSRTDPPLPNVHYINLETCAGNRVLHFTKEGLVSSGDPKYTVTCGTGLLLVKKPVFDRLTQFYLDCEFERMLWELPADHPKVLASIEVRKKAYELTHNGWWFELLPRLIGTGQTGEDVSFCIKAAMCGFKVHCDTTIRPGHVGEYVYQYRDYEPFKENEIKKAKAKGQYCEI